VCVCVCVLFACLDASSFPNILPDQGGLGVIIYQICNNMALKENGLNLSHIIGLTTVSNSCLVCCPVSGDIFYAAGCVVVRHSVRNNEQEGFITVPRAISCLDISSDGTRLAVGERGHLPCCTIWDLATRTQVYSLAGHKNGIGCVAISPSGKFIVTVGFKHDRQLIFWSGLTGTRLSVYKLGNKVRGISFHRDESYFVTCGDKHLKYWTLSTSADGETTLTGRAASILEEHKDAVFMDVCCGHGAFTNKVFCTTSTGVLCTFNESTMIEHCVNIESRSTFALALVTTNDGKSGQLLVGCANGVIRSFSADSLEYIRMLPLPCPLSDLDPSPKYPACYALRSSPSTQGLAAIYADRSLFVWNVEDLASAEVAISKCYHRGCVWDFCFLNEYYKNDELSYAYMSQRFATCSADNSVRVWNLEKARNRNSEDELLHSIELVADENTIAAAHRKGYPRTGGLHHANVGASVSSLASQDSSVATEPSVGLAIGQATLLGLPSNRGDSAGGIGALDLSAGLPDTEIPDRPTGVCAPRAIALHPQGNRVVSGDKLGKLSLIDLDAMRVEVDFHAHSAEILTLSFSPILKKLNDNSWVIASDSDYKERERQPGSIMVLLASAGRDRLIHVFDATIELVRGPNNKMQRKFRGFRPICTLDHHSSSVTVVKFSADGQRFISCGGDKTMVFCSVNGPTITKLKSIQTPHGTINGLAIEATNKFAVTSGQDKRLNIWNLQSGKHMRAYKNEAVTGELYKADTDPSGWDGIFIQMRKYRPVFRKLFLHV
jgi:WD40 repeat protein